MARLTFRCCLLLTSLCLPLPAAADERIPHAQDRPPGPALAPQDAIARMTVPPGFSVELIAAEPDVVNPTAMTIDERGRYWITESLEYPRRSPGPGKDRVRVLEDTDGDGRTDQTTVFMEGLNIPSGIAVGHGGVWVANAPDLLFVQDTDGDGKADSQEVVVTGFGRDDTHELPNSLTWGPDGWLYGLNGVFNPSHIRYGPSNPNFKADSEGWKFTCAMFRIHPATREFQVFCEGTSNPWGIAFDDAGEAFVSACVIDHLWHLTETGYYHRQGGPYPPFTWKIDSIVQHRHQKAAYCGIHWYDSDAYPEPFRRKLYMGNIHGGCINSDRVIPQGATYRGEPENDLLTANDAWFMPVVQKTGPDGCLCILDWYDRYHCYQDANRDPGGIDRLRGRLYRIRYQNTPHSRPFNLATETDQSLLEMLSSPNGFRRDTAQRLLSERLLKNRSPQLQHSLHRLGTDNPQRETRLRCLGILSVAGMLEEPLLLTLLQDSEPIVRARSIRAARELRTPSPELLTAALERSSDAAHSVRLQTVITAARQPAAAAMPVLVSVLAQADDDHLTPRIVWKHLQPLLEQQAALFVAEVRRQNPAGKGIPASVLQLLPRIAERVLAAATPDNASLAALLDLLLLDPTSSTAADQCLQLLLSRLRSGETTAAAAENLGQLLRQPLQKAVTENSPVAVSALQLLVATQSADATKLARQKFEQATDPELRLQLLDAFIIARTPDAEKLARSLIESNPQPELLRKIILATGRIRTPEASRLLLEKTPTLPPDVRPAAIEILTDQLPSSIQLMELVRDGKVEPGNINSNQARKMLLFKDQSLMDLVTRHWGSVRTERDPARQELIARMRNELRVARGNPVAGKAVFAKVCGQCHKMYGEGADVGPDITRNGRASFEQLLSNVFDPSLVIGAAYQAQTIVTTNGQIITGLPAEDNDQRVVLKIQGNRTETVPRSDIEQQVTSPLSLMPEGLEKQLQPSELHDLFAWLTLDKPPTDPNARFLPGARIEPGKARKTADYPQFVEQLLPGFSVESSGEGGIELLENHFGRPALRTHPPDKNRPCRLSATMQLPVAAKIKLRISVASHEQGDWQLDVKINGQQRHKSIIRPNQNPRWKDLEIDLSDLSGQKVSIDLFNTPNDWSNEFGFWNSAEVVSE
ncbi:MAG: PVC-type heme-binding CxxCH protein [Planctomyces sp.]